MVSKEKQKEYRDKHRAANRESYNETMRALMKAKYTEAFGKEKYKRSLYYKEARIFRNILLY